MFRLTGPILASLCLLISVHVESAETANWKVANIREGRMLNVRNGPSQEFTVVGALAYDATNIRNYGCFPQYTIAEWRRFTQTERSIASKLVWCRVAYDNIEGWVNFRYLVEY